MIGVVLDAESGVFAAADHLDPRAFGVSRIHCHFSRFGACAIIRAETAI
jgi:hypothetical protein